MKRAKFAVSFLLAVVFAIAAGIGAQSVLGGEEKGHAVFERIESSKVPNLSDHFSVLESTMSSVELPPLLRLAWSDNVSSTPSTVTVGETRTQSGRSVTLVANDDAVCVTDQTVGLGGGAACARPEDALSGQLFLVTVCEPGLPDGQVRVIGVLPDGASKLQISSTAKERLIGIRSNVFEATIPAIDSRLDTEIASRDLSVNLPLEAMALAPGETCQPAGAA